MLLPFFNGERTPDLPHARGCLLGMDLRNTHAAPTSIARRWKARPTACATATTPSPRAGLQFDRIALTGGGSQQRGVAADGRGRVRAAGGGAASRPKAPRSAPRCRRCGRIGMPARREDNLADLALRARAHARTRLARAPRCPCASTPTARTTSASCDISMRVTPLYTATDAASLHPARTHRKRSRP